jgi:hypothetical protein
LSLDDIHPSEMDAWLAATACVWANLATILAVFAARGRSAGAALAAALGVVPALLAGIARLHPASSQAFALPIGLYLLAVAHAVRHFGGPKRAAGATMPTWLGAVVLLSPGLAESFDEGKIAYALWTAIEGLAAVGWGIATRSRALAICGVAAVVAVALRQLFDAVYALPSWALLGGAGLLLLGGAVGLLALRARIQATGRLVLEHWSRWD